MPMPLFARSWRVNLLRLLQFPWLLHFLCLPPTTMALVGIWWTTLAALKTGRLWECRLKSSCWWNSCLLAARKSHPVIQCQPHWRTLLQSQFLHLSSSAHSTFIMSLISLWVNNVLFVLWTGSRRDPVSNWKLVISKQKSILTNYRGGLRVLPCSLWNPSGIPDFQVRGSVGILDSGISGVSGKCGNE